MAFLYNLLRCSDNQPKTGYSNTSGSVQVGKVYKVGATCYRVLQVANPAQGTPQFGDINLEGVLFYDDCATCNNPPGQGGGGGSNQGGGSGPTQTFYYRIRPCNQPNAPLIFARRTSQFADLETNSVVKGPGGSCYVVIQFDSVPTNPVSQYGLDLTNQPKYQTCSECTYVPPAPWKVIYTLESCQNPATTTPAYRFPLSTETPGVSFGWTIGEVYKVNNVCWRVKNASWQQTDALNGPNLSNISTYTNCVSCNLSISDQGLGPGGGTPTNLPFGYNCTPQGCQIVYYNPAAGEEPQYFTLAECQANCQAVGPDGGGTPSALLTGYRCDNNQCQSYLYDPASGEEPQFTSLVQCQQSGCGQQNPVVYRCTLRNCANPNDTIQGFTSIFVNPGVIYRFNQTSLTWRCYTLISIIGTQGPSINQGVNLEGKLTYQTCVQCLPDAMDPEPDPEGPTGEGDESNTPFCVQFPNHPTCDPCYNTPCAAGCPLDCTKCQNDPRCRPGNPCDDVPEPVQGDLLITWWAGPPNYQQREPYSYNWMIDSCWQWKYCVCRTQPDPNDPYTYEFRVCLCGDPIDDYTNPCPAAGALVRYECRNTTDPNSSIKLEKWGIYTNGSCGTYDQFIEANSVYCGATSSPTCPSTGTLIRTYCINTDKYGEYNDGNCGKYIERIEVNSKTCGYVDPPPPPPPPPPTVVTEPPAAARVYYPVRKEDTLRTNDVTSFALWSNDTPYLLTPSTQSLSDSSSLNYILAVYDKSPDTNPTCSAELQYNIIYADYEGKGATDLGGYDNQTLTKAMYTQYAHVLLPYGQTKFNFNGQDEDYVYIIDIARKRFKQSLDPGNWEITFASSSFSLETGSNSILSNMYTASYRNATLTLVDAMTKRPSNQNPVYFSSKPYDVYIGTLEDGIGTNFVTSSIVSASLATPGDNSYISTGTAPTAQTVIVKGARTYYFGLDGTVHYQVVDGVGTRVYINPPTNIKNVQPDVTMTATYSMSRQEVISEYGYYLVKYAGWFTGSFALPIGATLTPTVISGSCVAQIYYDASGQPQAVPADLQYIEGYTFRTKQDSFAGIGKQRLTVSALSYDGLFKWHTVPQPIGNLFSGSYAFNVPNIQGTYSGSTNLAFLTDPWGIQEYIEDTTDPFTDFSNFEDLDNGFILSPVKRTVYGQVYPSHGIIVLSGTKLDELLGLNTNRSIDKNGYNTYRLHHSMELVLDTGLTDLSGDKLAFYARGVDIKRSARYFITLKNSHLNYSNNPTYVSGSEGDIVDSFIRQNKAYFSSVGLYNDDKELLAIGKVSKPIMSSLTDEMLFTVKITQ